MKSHDQDLAFAASGVDPKTEFPGQQGRSIPRGKDMLVAYVDDDEHLKDFAESMPCGWCQALRPAK